MQLSFVVSQYIIVLFHLFGVFLKTKHQEITRLRWRPSCRVRGFSTGQKCNQIPIEWVRLTHFLWPSQLFAPQEKTKRAAAQVACTQQMQEEPQWQKRDEWCIGHLTCSWVGVESVDKRWWTGPSSVATLLLLSIMTNATSTLASAAWSEVSVLNLNCNVCSMDWLWGGGILMSRHPFPHWP